MSITVREVRVACCVLKSIQLGKLDAYWGTIVSPEHLRHHMPSKNLFQQRNDGIRWSELELDHFPISGKINKQPVSIVFILARINLWPQPAKDSLTEVSAREALVSGMLALHTPDYLQQTVWLHWTLPATTPMIWLSFDNSLLLSVLCGSWTAFPF